MNEDRNQDRSPKQQAKPKRSVPWRQDLNPTPAASQNVGQPSDAAVEAEWTAFHLRKRGLDSGAVNEGEGNDE